MIKINIGSYGGRNWLLETTKQLGRHGYDVKFYSYLPKNRSRKLGLKKSQSSSNFLLSLPFLFFLRITKGSRVVLYVYHRTIDLYVGLFMRRCDIFIAQSPMYVFAIKQAKKKFNSKVIVERGTRHVLEQIVALSTNPIYKTREDVMPERFVKRDLMGYSLADFISVPSKIVCDSFVSNGFRLDMILVNPFGVNLKEFRPTSLSSVRTYDLIFVGQWCHRKGCDLLVEVCKLYNYSLLHVGSIVDVAFPFDDPRFLHIDPVQEADLIKYYSMSKVFILPSREEGLALVQPQAIVCGLPLVISKYTGGSDFVPFLNDSRWIIEIGHLNSLSIHTAIEEGLSLSNSQVGLRNYCDEEFLKFISWNAYGDRYHDFIKTNVTCGY